MRKRKLDIEDVHDHSEVDCDIDLFMNNDKGTSIKVILTLKHDVGKKENIIEEDGSLEDFFNTNNDMVTGLRSGVRTASSDTIDILKGNLIQNFLL